MPAAWRVISAEVLPEARLRVRFVDGTVGEVEMQGFLQRPEVVGTVFRAPAGPRVLRADRRCIGRRAMAKRRGPGT